MRIDGTRIVGGTVAWFEVRLRHACGTGEFEAIGSRPRVAEIGQIRADRWMRCDELVGGRDDLIEIRRIGPILSAETKPVTTEDRVVIEIQPVLPVRRYFE